MREIFNDRSTNKEYETFSHFLRKLRYEIQSSEGKVFLITSTQVKAGKTFLIISLSYALSLVSKKVLIIDTNFRHNSLTKALLPQGRGGENRKLLKKALLFEEKKMICCWKKVKVRRFVKMMRMASKIYLKGTVRRVL